MKPLALIVAFSLAFTTPAFAADTGAIPPGAEEAKARLEKSPRHGEFINIAREGEKPIRSYIVFPERTEKAPVVIVIHEIFGLSDWVRGVADQLAADGFIAIAPDFLSGKGPNGGGTEAFAGGDGVRSAELIPAPGRNRAEEPVRRSVVSAPFPYAAHETMLRRGVRASPATVKALNSTALLAGTWNPIGDDGMAAPSSTSSSDAPSS